MFIQTFFENLIFFLSQMGGGKSMFFLSKPKRIYPKDFIPKPRYFFNVFNSAYDAHRQSTCMYLKETVCVHVNSSKCDITVHTFLSNVSCAFLRKSVYSGNFQPIHTKNTFTFDCFLSIFSRKMDCFVLLALDKQKKRNYLFHPISKTPTHINNHMTCHINR